MPEKLGAAQVKALRKVGHDEGPVIPWDVRWAAASITTLCQYHHIRGVFNRAKRLGLAVLPAC